MSIMTDQEQDDAVFQMEHCIRLVQGMYWLLDRRGVWSHVLWVVSDKERQAQLSWNIELMNQLFNRAVTQYGVR